jgi:hypothetical protein
MPFLSGIVLCEGEILSTYQPTHTLTTEMTSIFGNSSCSVGCKNIGRKKRDEIICKIKKE